MIKEIKMSQLFCIFHDGTLDGDSSFYPDSRHAYACDGSETLEQIKQQHRPKIAEEQGYDINNPDDQDDLEEYVEQIEGAWVVDQAILDDLEIVGDFGDSDSACYEANCRVKKYLNKKALSFIGSKPKA